MIRNARTGAPLALALLLTLALPAVASAQGFGFSFGHHGRHSGFGIGFSTGHAPVSCAPARVWIPAHYETVCQQAWVPGCSRQVWVEATYETRYDRRGHAYQVMTCPSHWATVQDGGHYETRNVQIWVEGRWA